jgi:hypothetical protein
MTHDHLCMMLRAVVTEEHDPKVCSWCTKISIIRDEEAFLASAVYDQLLLIAKDEAFDAGYRQGVADMKAGERLED